MNYKLLRISKNIKLKELAEYMCISSTLICLYEKGSCGMSLQNIRKYKAYIENAES